MNRITYREWLVDEIGRIEQRLRDEADPELIEVLRDYLVSLRRDAAPEPVKASALVPSLQPVE
jgi:hypothetical protein